MVALLPVKKVEGWNSKRNTQLPVFSKWRHLWVSASDIKVHKSYNTH